MAYSYDFDFLDVIYLTGFGKLGFIRLPTFYGFHNICKDEDWDSRKEKFLF